MAHKTNGFIVVVSHLLLELLLFQNSSDALLLGGFGLLLFGGGAAVLFQAQWGVFVGVHLLASLGAAQAGKVVDIALHVLLEGGVVVDVVPSVGRRDSTGRDHDSGSKADGLDHTTSLVGFRAAWLFVVNHRSGRAAALAAGEVSVDLGDALVDAHIDGVDLCL